MKKILFTEEFCQPEKLHPFTLTRQIQDIRVGILTIREKWERMLDMPSFDKFESDYKDLGSSLTPEAAVADGDVCYLIHGNILPTPLITKAVRKLKNGEFLSTASGEGFAFRFTKNEVAGAGNIRVAKQILYKEELTRVTHSWDIFRLNDQAIRQDFKLITKGRRSQKISKTNQVINRTDIFIEKGAKVDYSILNASTGPIYIGAGAEIMEGAFIRGPFAMGEGSVLKMGTKVYGATTLGPRCVAGGEIKNSVLFGYSNKAHDGYLGDSVIGEWCNLGAGTTNSNIKNNAGAVNVWTSSGVINTGTKCGMIMGDYSRTAINTAINTGTVIGVSSNVFGAGLTPKYIPNFSWGHDGIVRYDFEKAKTDISAWMRLKNCTITEDQLTILKHIFEKF